MNKIIAELKQALQDQCISESRAAKMAGLPQKTVNNLLSGRTKRLDIGVVGKLQKVLGVTPLGGEGASRSAESFASIHEGISLEELEALRIMRECPEALSVVKMMGSMDRDAQKDVQLSVEKEKLLRDLLKERSDKNVA